MDQKVENALDALIRTFGKVGDHDVTAFSDVAKSIFDSEQVFTDKVAALDEAVDNSPQLESLREILFDLLLINFFSEDVQKLEEDYLDSPEWEAIEEETLERGTELLNVLLYLKECEDEGIEPGLDDYLKEFLLVDEDEFQDEHHIYEDVIANQMLVESSYEEIARTAGTISDSSEMKELFYPFMSFFYEPEPGEKELELYISKSIEPDFDAAVYTLLISYNA
ncbi:hypothetical protein GS399_20080 [Pedobacter sp. HMF7647]|uniref:Uncharacterized protein n=2 Tax=Hufsiella arboris TaxID=2695275 RepID=A0A7K1YFR7_9SPHI|nr:hypothetical protein [Hufsiella arboris]MXV53271.1 hypothetical protein [Hufsiella arboris]